MNPLATQHCRPQDGQPPMDAEQVAAQLTQLPGWAVVDGAIEKTYRFADFHQTMAFVNALAWVAHREDHHPDLRVSYRECSVRYHTHSVGGITRNDFVCAARIDALGADPASTPS